MNRTRIAAPLHSAEIDVCYAAMLRAHHRLDGACAGRSVANSLQRVKSDAELAEQFQAESARTLDEDASTAGTKSC